MLNTSAAAADLFSLNELFSGLAGCTRVAVAVSGGSDSMALLMLASDWVKAAGVQFVALTVDHGLRAASVDEARQVSQWCSRLNIEHHVLLWRGEKPKTGIQAAARSARYDLMSAWCVSHGVDALLTAHTLDDQAETVVMRQQRTKSAKSLAGIWPETLWNGLRVVRPLLETRREELRHVLRACEQAWIDDPSNVDERFERVRVRKTLNAGDAALLSEVARDAQRTSRQLADLTSSFFSEAVKIDRMGCVTIPRQHFGKLNADVACDVLARAIFVAGAGGRPLREGVAQMVAWVGSGGTSRRTLAGAVVALRTEEILVAREAGRIVDEWLLVSNSPVWDERFAVAAPPGCLVGPMKLAKGLERQADVPIFVWNGLPVVKMPDGRVILACDGEKFAISAIFRERIWF